MPLYNFHLYWVKFVTSSFDSRIHTEETTLWNTSVWSTDASWEQHKHNLNKMIYEVDWTECKDIILTLLTIETNSSREDKELYEDSRSISLPYAFCFGRDNEMLKKSAMIYEKKDHMIKTIWWAKFQHKMTILNNYVIQCAWFSSANHTYFTAESYSTCQKWKTAHWVKGAEIFCNKTKQTMSSFFCINLNCSFPNFSVCISTTRKVCHCSLSQA